jgi:hypothetical protein
MSRSSNLFGSSRNPDYDLLRTQLNVGANDLIFNFAISHILHPRTGGADANYWQQHWERTPVASALGVTCASVRLLAAARDVLTPHVGTDTDPTAQAAHFSGAIRRNVIVAAVLDMSQSTLANGGRFGMNFGRTADKNETRVMVGALRLSGLRAAAADTAEAALQILSQAYLRVAYTLRSLTGPEQGILQNHQQLCFIAAAQPLTKKFEEDAVLGAMETHGMARGRVQGMWRHYDAALADDLTSS